VLWGLLKKVVVADNMGNLVELCRGNMAVRGSGVVLALAFTVQIYADFSGYTDIARGCARLFGVRLRRNFLTPYFSCSPSEFWQRWHISLSSWIRDYVYIPLGGNRCGALGAVRNVLVTMLLAGLWHGAGWFFIAWGLYHGLLLVLYRLFPLDAWLTNAWGSIGKVMAAICFFGLTVAGWVLFYLGSNGTFGEVFFPAHAAVPAVGLGALAYGLCLFALPLVLTDWLGYRKNREFIDLWPHLPPAGKTLLYVLVFYAIVMFGARDSHEFIYFRF
jgi:alginate O-acetyltransferase complex protein AlgI